MINSFLLGATAFGAIVAALVFLRSWHRTGDRLFALFAAAFALLAVDWSLLALTHFRYVFLGRLVAFALIIVAVVDKNRARRGSAIRDAEGPTE